MQEGQGTASKLTNGAPSGLDHGKLTIKNETKSTLSSNENNDIGDIQMDDDDDDILGEIEGMDTMA